MCILSGCYRSLYTPLPCTSYTLSPCTIPPWHYESPLFADRPTIGVASIGDAVFYATPRTCGERAVSTCLPRSPFLSSSSSGVAAIVPVQVSSTNPAQISSTSSAGSIAPTGFVSTSSSRPHNSRKGAIAGGIVGGISVVLLLGFAMWLFRRCARKRASTRRGLGGDPEEKLDGVVGLKDDKSTASGSSSPGNANPQEAIASPLPSMPRTEIAGPIPPTRSDSTPGSHLPDSNVHAIEIAPTISPNTSDSTAGSHLPDSNVHAIEIAPPISPTTSDSTASSPLPVSNVHAIPQTEIAPPIPLTTSDSTPGSHLPDSNVHTIPQTEIAPPIPLTTSDSTVSWKYYITALPEMPLMSSKVVFAVDASDSTAGPIMQRQREFVLAMVQDYQLPSSVIMWGSSVERPKSAAQIRWDQHRYWGTSPEVIFADAASIAELKSCNMWFLLTDGEVDSPVNFARKALETGMANTPVVFVITGTKLTSTTDISVGLPVFASAPDAAIVFKNAVSGEIYVIAAKGAFEVLMAGYKINLTNLNWKSLPLFHTESAFKHALEGISIVDTARLETAGAVYLSRAWHEKHQCFVRIDRLLKQMPPQSISETELLDLLEDETFKALALSCKTRGIVQNLRDWLLAKYEQPRDMPAVHRPHLDNFSLFTRISRCLEKLTALENTGFDVGILEWSSHRSLSAVEAVSSPKVVQEPEVFRARSSTGAQAMIIRIMFNSLPIFNSPTTSASASDEDSDFDPSTTSGDQRRWRRRCVGEGQRKPQCHSDAFERAVDHQPVDVYASVSSLRFCVRLSSPVMASVSSRAVAPCTIHAMATTRATRTSSTLNRRFTDTSNAHWSSSDDAAGGSKTR
ncbi:hypothetical protein GGX14DRAFT_604234 [Mycena pura]|uniref:Uncharacterized protein n=1 Tax=Mycena pura TaxID=153505 RepID=A0AAD6Y1R6_9AGAR|nr:hypothetical protein GGX14DRAFT_604234 [Mycena pura]